MTTTTFTRHIATDSYEDYIVCMSHTVTPAQSAMLLSWMKSWTKEQRLWIFRHFAVGDNGALTKLQGIDIRPYLVDIAFQLSVVKGHSVLTGHPM
jgi:hypothetical protein